MPAAIVLAAHGSRHPRAAGALEAFARRAAERHPDALVRLVATAADRHRDAGREGGASPLEGALLELRDLGVRRAVVLSLHVVPGREFEEIAACAARLRENGRGFERLAVAGPLLSEAADMEAAARALLAALPAERRPDEAVVMMGHGSKKPVQGLYDALESAVRQRDPNVFFATLEARRESGADSEAGGGLGLEGIKKKLGRRGFERVWLLPFLTVSGAHAHHDLAGPGERSWKSALEAAGAVCRADLAGLIEREPFVELWLDLLDRAAARLDTGAEPADGADEA